MKIQCCAHPSIVPSVFSLLLCTWPLVAAAAEIKVLAPGGVRSALLGAASSYEHETGNGAEGIRSCKIRTEVSVLGK